MPAKRIPAVANRVRRKKNGASQQMQDEISESTSTISSVHLRQAYGEVKREFEFINIVFEKLLVDAHDKTMLESRLKESIATEKKLQIEINRLRKMQGSSLADRLEKNKETDEDIEHDFEETKSLTNAGTVFFSENYVKRRTSSAHKGLVHDPCKLPEQHEFEGDKSILIENNDLLDSTDEDKKKKKDNAFEENGADKNNENEVQNVIAVKKKPSFIENFKSNEPEFVKPFPISTSRKVRRPKGSKARLDYTIDLTEDSIIPVTSEPEHIINCKDSVSSNILSVLCESKNDPLTEKMKTRSYKVADPKEKTKKPIHGEINDKTTNQLIEATNNEIEPDERANLKLTPKKDLKSTKKRNNVQASLFNKSPTKYPCTDGPYSKKLIQSLTKNRGLLKRSSSFARSVSTKTGHGFSLAKRNAVTKKIVGQASIRQPVLRRVLANDLRGKLAHLTTPERKAVLDHQRQAEDIEVQRLVSVKHDEAMRRKQQKIIERTNKLKDERKQREALVQERKRLVAEERANRLQSPAPMAKCGLRTPARPLGDASTRLNVPNVTTHQIQNCATFNINRDKATRKLKDDDHHITSLITTPVPTETFVPFFPVIIDDSKSFSCEQKSPEIAVPSNQKCDQESIVFQTAASSSSFYLSSMAPVPAIIDSTSPEAEPAQNQTVDSNRKSSRKRIALVTQGEKSKEVLDQNSPSPGTAKRSKSKKMRSLSTAESYDMTPLRIIEPSTATNYNIDDLNSGDETDDDEAPRKEIPSWAKGSQLKSRLVKLGNLSDKKAICVFGIPDKIDIEEIFGKHRLYKKRHRHLHRGETGDWQQPIFTSTELKEILGNDHDKAHA